ncbi:MAG: hypothetical protein ACRD44_03225 [Bryobacteraceae bacterium]
MHLRPGIFSVAAGLCIASAQERPRIIEWERGVALEAPGGAATMYLWFYEWNMFDAMAPGQHTKGTYDNERHINRDGTAAEIRAAAIQLLVSAVRGGAELTLRVTNTTDGPWPAIAGIIPCWNPGRVEGTNPSSPEPLNRNFADPGKSRTFFANASGPTALTSREIHFNHTLRALVDREPDSRQFVFSSKWPTSPVNATAGYIVRSSEDGRWVTGIGWDDYLSVQGHNPWSCMHACARVGPLGPSESKTIRGRLALFRGSVDDGVRYFSRERTP